MKKKASNNNQNRINDSNKGSDGRTGYNNDKSYDFRKISEINDECVPLYDEDCLWDLDQDPLASYIPVGPELQGLGIQYIILFERNLIFETKDGIVYLTMNKEESHSLYHPLKRPLRNHARALMKTTSLLLNTKEFNYSVRERMNGP